MRTLLIAEQADIRAIVAHAIDEQEKRFYQRFGFEPAPLPDKRLFMLLLKDARKLFADLSGLRWADSSPVIEPNATPFTL